MMDHLFVHLSALYTGAFTRESAPDDESERVNKLIWKAHFQRNKLTWRQIKEALDHATTDSKSMPWPNLAGFMALVERNARTERGLNHASRQPVAQVLGQHTGAKAHQLPPETQACKAQRKQVAREHMAKMRQLLD